MTHDMKDCYELNQCKKCAKPNTSHNGSDKVTYKDLNAFVNAKVTAALKKAKSQNKRKEAKKVIINAFDKFCNLKVDSSNEESNPEVNALAAVANNDSNPTAKVDYKLHVANTLGVYGMILGRDILKVWE
eukprot:2224110-Ditylum_brightwellii.AAC.1